MPRGKSIANVMAICLSIAGLLVSIFWDTLLAGGSNSTLQQAARAACPFLHDNALANAVKHVPLLPAAPASIDHLPYMSAEHLATFNGHQRGDIAVGFAGVAYDVTSAAHLFGPHGEFHALAGRHATRAILKSSTREEDAVAFIDDLDAPAHAVEATADILARRFPPIARLPM